MTNNLEATFGFAWGDSLDLANPPPSAQPYVDLYVREHGRLVERIRMHEADVEVLQAQVRYARAETEEIRAQSIDPHDHEILQARLIGLATLVDRYMRAAEKDGGFQWPVTQRDGRAIVEQLEAAGVRKADRATTWTDR